MSKALRNAIGRWPWPVLRKHCARGFVRLEGRDEALGMRFDVQVCKSMCPPSELIERQNSGYTR